MTPDEYADGQANAIVRVEPAGSGTEELHYADLAFVSICGEKPIILGRKLFTKLHDAIALEIKTRIFLSDAIAKHRDQRGHDRCWLDDKELYATIGDNGIGSTEEYRADNVVDQTLPPREEFLAGCARYHDLRKSGVSHDHLSLTEVLAENDRLRKAAIALVAELSECMLCNKPAEWSAWSSCYRVYACDEHRKEYEDMHAIESVQEAMKLFIAAVPRPVTS